MSIDKRINFRGGGMDMGNTKSQARSASMGNTTSRSTSSGTGGSKGNLGGGGGGQGSDYRSYKAPTKPTYTAKTIDSKPITGADYERGRNQFIDKFNLDKARSFNKARSLKPSFFKRTYKPITLNEFGARNQKTGLNQGLATLLSFATGIPFNLLSQGKEVFSNLNNKITNIRDKINNFQGDYRQKFTGYRTQQDYDNARQNRINLKSIDRIQNTLNRKYPDGDYSNTDLDERLADLKQSMGIVSNTPEQNEQQYLNFGNPNMANLNDVQSIFSAPTQGITGIKFPEQFNRQFDINEIASLIEASKQPQGINYTNANARRAMTQPGFTEQAVVYDPYGINLEDGRFSYDMNKTSVDDFTGQPKEGIMSYPSDLANEFQDMAIQAGNYAQNEVGNQLYGKEYDVLNPFEQQQIDKAIETYGTKSTGQLASGTSSDI